jgi:fumarylacetoacetase
MPQSDTPVFGPSKRMDYELEVGVFIGVGNSMGHPIPLADADRHLFGMCLLNDWSARDIQGWEYQPLGPFLTKNFASVLSPWIVTFEALAPFRVAFARPAGDPQPLPYLDSPAEREGGAYDVQLDVFLETETMRRAGAAPQRLSHTSFRHAYWTVGQTAAHHTVNGCQLNPGDCSAAARPGPHG